MNLSKMSYKKTQKMTIKNPLFGGQKMIYDLILIFYHFF
jgi:hypothetical protein